jgi:hypothetical protein
MTPPTSSQPPPDRTRFDDGIELSSSLNGIGASARPVLGHGTNDSRQSLRRKYGVDPALPLAAHLQSSKQPEPVDMDGTCLHHRHVCISSTSGIAGDDLQGVEVGVELSGDAIEQADGATREE